MKNDQKGSSGSPTVPCSPSSDTPETDMEERTEYDNQGRPYDEGTVGADFARMLERDRNSETRWAKHYKDERDELRSRIDRIENLCTTDHESKEAFVARVRDVLLENAKGLPPADEQPNTVES